MVVDVATISFSAHISGFAHNHHCWLINSNFGRLSLNAEQFARYFVTKW